ncbi:phenylacetyl-CoA ligase [Microthyrium microscopicum]|uniref:Phenylacetyl-CoA ligase n=1 Tax=Microthyrium microscopicum TaxID=703497 RepID=A0A6A6UFA7_9PEZI|nr:phenylacetyl-CoA ligase [Microthyrium microscopicum]
MPIKSRWTVDIPDISLPTFLFGSPTVDLPTTPLIIDPRAPDDAYLTMTTYRLWAQRFAAGLLRNGFQKGDRLLLFSGNTIFFPVIIMGTIMAGGIFSGANPSYVPRELAYQLKDTGARFLITSEASLDTALEAAQMVGVDKSRLFAFDDGLATAAGQGKNHGEVRHWSTLLASEAEGKAYAWPELSSEELDHTSCTLNYSSGTTGVPKGVEITHRNYVANSVQIQYQNRLDPDFEAVTARAKLLCFLPMYHAYGLTVFTLNAAIENIPSYIMNKFDFVTMLEYVERFRISFLVLVPPVVVAMAKSPLTKKYDLSAVERVGCGAAPLGREVCVELEKLWPQGVVNVKQGWGMTELTCSAMGWDPTHTSESFSVGELNANCEALLLDDSGSEVSQGERGEIWISAPNVMKGYWNKPEATAETLTTDKQGKIWLKTGDIAYIDDQNRFYIVDRKKELIKVKGNQVAPAELEALLLDLDPVADAAVIGVSIEDEEYPRAYIQVKEGQTLTEAQVHEFMNKRVAFHKRLTGGVRFIDAIPKNPSGKILRKILKDAANAEQKAPKAKL